MDLRTIKSTVVYVLVGLLAYQGSARSEVYQSGIIDSIARSFGIELSDSAIELEQVPLSPAFRESFRSRSSLTAAAVRDYLNAHPSELLAFRDYSQSLHDSGYLDYDSTLLLIRSAFAGFAQNPGFLAEPTEKRVAVAVPAGGWRRAAAAAVAVAAVAQRKLVCSRTGQPLCGGPPPWRHSQRIQARLSP